TVSNQNFTKARRHSQHSHSRTARSPKVSTQPSRNPMSPFGSFCNSHCTHVQAARPLSALSLTCHFLLVILAADAPRSDNRRRFSTEGNPDANANRAPCCYPIDVILPHSL